MNEKLIQEESVFRGDFKKSWNKSISVIKSLKTIRCSGLRMRGWFLVLFGFLLTWLFILNFIITGQYRVTHPINATQDNLMINNEIPELLNDYRITSGFLVHNKGCRIADSDPFDEFSKRYMEIEKPIECEFGNKLPLVESNDTFLYINTDSINQYYNTTDTVKCSWRSFFRKKNSDNIIKFHGDYHVFNDSTKVPSDTEFVKVECFKDGKNIYRDYFFFVPRKIEVEERCESIEKESNNSAENIKIQQRKLSVLMIGLDSVSRLNFHRMMPKTVETLKKYGAIEMLGYNKVGDNTYPNLVPVLAGLSENELKKNYWNDTNKPFDDCPFLWSNFSESGYRTIFAEDACAMTTFNYLKPGFQKQPTDYYYRPYCLAVEKDIGNTHKLNADLCLGTRLTYQNLLNYTKKIAKEFSNDPYFGFFWEASLTHDFFNYPQLGDNSYQETLEYFHDNDLLNNTLLIMMSDHGIRWGEFRQTYQGRIEGSLPFVFMIFPEWWKKENSIAWKNLQHNTASLTTPYDLHETIVDILKSTEINNEFIHKKLLFMNKLNDDEKIPRGLSWFLPIPDHRTCEMAGIPGHFCMCHTSNNISTDDLNIKKTTIYLVKKLNNMLKNYSQCAKLELKNIIDAKMWNPTDEKNDIVPWTDYTVTIETIPGNAIFEATIRHNLDNISSSSTLSSSISSLNNEKNKLVGSISRLNAYGKQSACVNDSKIRLYCFCQ